MPPATAPSKISLRELADLAIGTPEVGAVNFTALHTLIVAMLKNLHLQDTRVDFQSLSPEPSGSFEGARASQSTPQVGVPKEKRRSTVARVPAQTLESQVKDLGGQVQDLGRQFKTMDSQVQGILDHMQYFTALVSGEDLDTQDWPGNQEMAKDLPQEMATPTTEMTTPTVDMATPTIEKTKLVKATPMPKMPTPVLGAATAMPETAIPVPGMATVVPEKVQRGVMKMWKDKPKVRTCQVPPDRPPAQAGAESQRRPRPPTTGGKRPVQARVGMVGVPGLGAAQAHKAPSPPCRPRSCSRPSCKRRRR